MKCCAILRLMSMQCGLGKIATVLRHWESARGDGAVKEGGDSLEGTGGEQRAYLSGGGAATTDGPRAGLSSVHTCRYLAMQRAELL